MYQVYEYYTTIIQKCNPYFRKKFYQDLFLQQAYDNAAPATDK